MCLMPLKPKRHDMVSFADTFFRSVGKKNGTVPIHVSENALSVHLASEKRH
jgi:hypothetical protein